MKKKRLRFLIGAIVLAAAAALIFASCAAGKADTVYINGNIYTVDRDFSKAEALAIKGDKIIYAGSASAAKRYRSGKTRVIDLEGKTVLPGLIDSHLHTLLLGTMREQIDLFDKSKAEILAAVQAEARRLGPGKWIVSFGWNNVPWGEDYPTKEDLDAAAPDNPVALSRIDGHSTWYNSLALRLANIDKNTAARQGGEILKKPNGEVWGILTDTAAEMVNSIIEDDATPERIKNRFLLADKHIISFGLTTVADAGILFNDLQILRDCYKDDSIRVRSYEMLEEGEDAAYLEAGDKPTLDYLGDGSKRLAVNAVKLYSDGSLGSRSAWLLAEYTDRPRHFGNGRYNDQAMFDAVKRAADEGFQIGTHAIGDAAVRQVINVYEKALGAALKDRRFRIEHFQIVDPEDMRRTVTLGIIPSMQANHATSDMNMAEDRIGHERIKSAYAWRTIIDAGAHIACGTDAPVELVNPWLCLYAAVTRQDVNGEPPGGWYPELAMTREEALRSYTIWGAQAIFAETDRGSLEKGKFADFVVIDRDYMTCPAAEIARITALRTVIGGKTVYEAE